MKSRVILVATILLGLAAGPSPAAARATDNLARIHEIANFETAADACVLAGYQIAKDRVTPTILASVDALGTGDRSAALTAVNAGFARKEAALNANLKAMNLAIGRDPKSPGCAADARAAVDRYAQAILAVCERATRDPAFAKVIVAPPGLTHAEAWDTLAAMFGRASFQPIEALAQGDLLYAVGLCRSFLSAADVRLYQGDVLDGSDPADPARLKLRRWYRAQMQDGLDRAGRLSRDDCLQTLPNLLSDLKVFKSL